MRDFSDALELTRKRVGDAEAYLKIEDLRARRPLLETEASRPDLWDDPDEAKRVTGELSVVIDDLELLRAPRRRARGRRDAARAGPGGRRRQPGGRDRGCPPVTRSRAPRARAAVDVLGRARRARRAVHDPGRGGGRRRPGLGRDALPDVRPLGRAPRLRGGGGGLHARLRGGRLVRRVRGEGPVRLRLPPGRAGRAPPGADEPVQRPGQAPDRLRGARRGADPPRGRGGGRGGRERHQDGRLPRLRRRRPAHQQDLLGRAPHPPAHRDRRSRARSSAPSSRTGPRR